MKRVLALVLCFLLAFANVGVVFADTESNSLKLTKVDQITDKFGEGDTVKVKITVSRPAGNSIENVQVSLDSLSNFQMKVDQYVNVIFNNNAIESNEVTLNLRYKGSGSALILYFTYTENGQPKYQTISYNVISSNGNYEEPSAPGSYSPKVVVNGTVTVPDVAAGSSVVVRVPLKNIGNATAKAISAVIDTGDAPMRGTFNAANTIDTLIAKKAAEMSFLVAVDKDAKKGKYPVSFMLEYQDSDGVVYNQTGTVNVYVTDSKKKPVMIVENVVQNPTTLKAGDKVTVSFRIKNGGELPANSVKVYVEGYDSKGIMPVDLAPYQYVDTLAAGKSQTFSYPLLVSEDSEGGIAKLNIKVVYKDSTDTEATESTDLFIKGIQKKDESGKGQPKLIISGYSATGNTSAGGEFNLRFTTLNTSATTAIYNVKIDVTPNDDTVVVKGGANSFWVDKVAAKGSLTKDIVFDVKNDALAKTVPISIKYGYEDAEGKGYDATETVSVAITEKINLMLNDVMAADGMTVDQPGTVSFKVINLGKGTLSNLTAKLESDTLIPTDSSMYLGNYESGKNESYDMEITPNQEGECTGTLVLTYEDSNGTKMELRRDFTAQVMPPMEEPPMEPPVNPEDLGPKPKMNQWIFLAGEAVLFLVCVVGMRMGYVKWYKKKHPMDEEL